MTSRNAYKIVLFGPESTGKSWLAEQLAMHYQTVWAAEYARTYLETKKKYYDFYGKGSDEICTPDDILPIVIGQIAREDDLFPFAKNHLFFCDTNPLQTAVYVKHYYHSVYAWLESVIEQRTYDLYLLTNIDIKWQPDPLRDRPFERESMFQCFESFLINRKLPYQTITGTNENRLTCAVNAVNNFLNTIA